MTDLEKILCKIPDSYVLDPSIPKSDYIEIDLSVKNQLNVDVTNADYFEKFLETYATGFDASVVFGGYNEKRKLYQRSPLFKENSFEERNIHIGMDLWLAANSPVFAALDGTVHSFGYNEGIGNYGPTIILQHEIDGISFYTLYGHLSKQSIQTIQVGDRVIKGTQFASLGDKSVNGDYAPHLHFQIILDMENYDGDYPGVCSYQRIEQYLANCPDPNLLLKLK